MLEQKEMREIQDLKMQGYTVGEIAQYLKGKRTKAPSIPTIRKYYQMDVVPDQPAEKLQKEKAFDNEPYKQVIINILEKNPNCCISSIYDLLEERYIDGGEVARLPGNQQTLRNYVRHLRESGEVSKDADGGRIYDHVFDTPPGKQMLLDFGEIRMRSDFTVHFICLLLRYSRMACVYAQDHKYNAQEACQAIYRGFTKLGGRPTELVIDQDSVFVASEVYGEVIKTQVFEAFCSEQGLSIWVCNKNDPESKGPIENQVGFVKKNYFSARNPEDIDDVLKTLPGWVERKNKRIHQATYRVPSEVFARIERETLRPLVPSLYEDSASSFTSVRIESMPFLQYKTSKYSVPRAFCHKTVLYKVIADTLYIFDTSMSHICSHAINPCKGSFNQLEEHRKEENGDWLLVVENLRAKWNCYDFQHFINGFKKENPRHIHPQLSAVEALLDAEKPARDFVAEVMKVCCQNFRYKYSQFEAVYTALKAGSSSGAARMPGIQHQELTAYTKAFNERCAQQRARQQEGGVAHG